MMINKLGQKILTILFLILIITLFPINYAHAYIDPGNGSYIIQMSIAVLFGAFFTLKHYWNNLISFLIRTKKKAKKDVK